jgi:hypothetical protein
MSKFSLFGRRKEARDALPPLAPGAFPLAVWLGGDQQIDATRALTLARSRHAPDLLDPRVSGSSRASANDLERPIAGHTLVHLSNEGLQRPIVVVGRPGSGMTSTLIRLAARAAEERQRTVIYLDGAWDAATEEQVIATFTASGRTVQTWTPSGLSRLRLFDTTEALLLRRLRETLVDLPLLQSESGALVELLLHTVIQMPPGLPRDVADLLARIDLVLEQVAGREADPGSVAALVARELTSHVRATSDGVDDDEDVAEERAAAHEDAWRTRQRVLGWAVRTLNPDLIASVRRALAERLGALADTIGADGWSFIEADVAYVALPPAADASRLAQRRVLLEALLGELLRRPNALPVTLVCDDLDLAALLHATGTAAGASGTTPVLAERLCDLAGLHARGVDLVLSTHHAADLSVLLDQALEIEAGPMGVVLATDAPEPLLEQLGGTCEVTDAAVEAATSPQNGRPTLREALDKRARVRVPARRALGLEPGECFVVVDGVVIEGRVAPVRVFSALLPAGHPHTVEARRPVAAAASEEVLA